MTTESVEDGTQRLLRTGPFLAALLGAVVVAFRLLMPIRIGPGDHEKNTSCGTAVAMDLGAWQRFPGQPDSAHYLDLAFRACTAERVDRIAQSVAVLTVTLLVVVVLGWWRSSREEWSSLPGERPPPRT
ncbi:hypothetical protein [Micromonospora humi]|uniref:Uncharacterized protein n=1 Tax=Micromonospora humi TaxID=745366 RepID=A0A1C5JW49_9ACTN|nr:hypothetical protein [Micromonospora humi]SCG74469.1 hypothetical protein GA0070213_114105 [Micromonospora humi]